MPAKSPSVTKKEMIGFGEFSQRREVFDKYDTIFLPNNISSNDKEFNGDTNTNEDYSMSSFRRSGPGYSSMRENRREDIRDELGFRQRKLSDNFTSDFNQRDDVDYRRSMTDRTRRLSKLRRDFLTSNLHEPTNDDPFARSRIRSSMPLRSAPPTYKIESPNLYKFPFAEPYETPLPFRRVVNEQSTDMQDKIDNKDPVNRFQYYSLPNRDNLSTDSQKLFEELIKRYSPKRKPIDWKLPPTKPRVVGTVPKVSSSDSIEGNQTDLVVLQIKEENTISHNNMEVSKQNYLAEKPSNVNEDLTIANDLANSEKQNEENNKKDEEMINKNIEFLKKEENRDSKISLTELAEKNDKVPELAIIQRQISRENPKRPVMTDITIPALIQKMTTEGMEIENHNQENRKDNKKKIKRKRSFIDKLLGRKKEK